MRIPLWKLEARFFNTAYHFSLACCAIIFGLWLGGLAEFAVKVERHETARVEKLKRERTAQKLLAHVKNVDTQREVVCLANIVHHEVRGELEGNRRLVATVVLAMRDDKKWPMPKTICGLAKHRGLFSNLKNPEVSHMSDGVWLSNFLLADDVYRGIWREQLLPRGWECVRSFMISKAYLDTLNEAGLERLGITKERRGIRFFELHREPVDTRGKKTFYGPKGGCENPLPTT